MVNKISHGQALFEEKTNNIAYQVVVTDKKRGVIEMICANCGENIQANQDYYRAGKSQTVFCSENCCYEAYEGYYSKKEITKTIERIKRLLEVIPAEKENPEFSVVDPEGVLEVAKIMEQAVKQEPPYVFEFIDQNGAVEKITSRENYLDHILSWAAETIDSFVEVNERSCK
ncbi:hypothetical protein [Virgibacillus pantothenticus]|uniref:hypothetical protein n=1 Tax=Virgibacillus pantothenticus TaxID=1473 RepID=UPI0025B1FD80|nr:hypothetical protein [Virgibacillus pantothenticus]